MKKTWSEEFTEFRDILLDFEDLLRGGFRRARETGEPVRVVVPPADGGGASAKKAASPGSGVPSAGGADRSGLLDAVAAEVTSCALCRLAAGRKHAVPGTGVPDPLVLVIGEGPGAEEDVQGLPFVGPAGRYLDTWLEAVGMSRRTNVFVANIVKCRPPGNRDPAPDEAAACFPYLERQADILRPRAVLALGRVAARNLLASTQGVGLLRGRTHAWKGIPLVVTYHPSAVLRDSNLRRPVWEDLKKLKELVGL